MIRALAIAAVSLAPIALSSLALAEGDPVKGATAFRQCITCHSLDAGRHETGPSLAGIYGRGAGKAEGFDRYSEPLSKAEFDWTPERLDAWLANPSRMLPGSRMTWSVPDAAARADLIAYLKALHDGKTEGLAIPRQTVLDLKTLGRAGKVAAIRHCRDSFFVTLENGAALSFWERNLRLRVDGSGEGPAPGVPAMLPGGMHGDRSTVIFRSAAEIGSTIKEVCEAN